MGASECQKRPEWEAKFWAGSSEVAGIERRQDGEIIRCDEPVFDEYVCMSYEDLKRLETDVLDKCERWKTEAQP